MQEQELHRHAVTRLVCGCIVFVDEHFSVYPSNLYHVAARRPAYAVEANTNYVGQALRRHVRICPGDDLESCPHKSRRPIMAPKWHSRNPLVRHGGHRSIYHDATHARLRRDDRRVHTGADSGSRHTRHLRVYSRVKTHAEPFAVLAAARV